MRGMPFNLTGKGALEAIAAQILVGEEQEEGGTFWSGAGHRREKGEVLEPRSVLYHRRSPSPPISTSTLSSSLSGGGSGASTDTGGVATVSENPAQKWPVSGSTAPFAPAEASGRKEEWSAELQSITGLPEMGGLAVSSEKCGIGIEDWETMLSASAASPSQEQTFLRWIMSDIDDSSAPKHHLHQPFSLPSKADFDVSITGPGFVPVDPVYGFETIGSIACVTSPSANDTASLPSSGVFYHCSRNDRFAEPSQPLFPQLSLLPGGKNSSFVSSQTAMSNPPPSLTQGMFFQETPEEKPHHIAPNLFHQTQSTPNPAFFLPLPSFNAPTELHHNSNLLPPHPKRYHSMPTYPTCQNPSTDAGQLKVSRYNLQQRMAKPRPSVTGEEASLASQQQQQQQQGLVDQLFKAAELVETGNFISAHGILARLNHQLSSPLGKPLLRSVFHFKEALQLLIANYSSNPPTSPSHHHRTPFTTPLVTPLDVVLKLSAYKAFSEVSPILHFTNFTVTQTLLEELGTANIIHIIDFDIGIGGQWSSFMQELAQQRHPSPVRLLKITAFVSNGSYHPLELRLTRENLSHFASELHIPFEINILNIESFDPAEILSASASNNETIAVNLPVGASLSPSFSPLLRLVKQFMPKIILSVDQGCDRSDLPFSHHFLHTLESSMILLDSLDAAGSNLDMVNKIERFVLQPRIENCIMGRHRAPDKMPQWRTLFASAGFAPVQFSSFTEMQAECLLKRVQVRGFHVERRQGSLCLHWHRGELVSVSAWSC